MTRRDRTYPGKAPEAAQRVPVRFPFLAERAGPLDQEVRERRHLQQLGPALGGASPEHLEPLPCQVTQLLVLGDIETS